MRKEDIGGICDDTRCTIPDSQGGAPFLIPRAVHHS
jgi:hypothetical protein